MDGAAGRKEEDTQSKTDQVNIAITKQVESRARKERRQVRERKGKKMKKFTTLNMSMIKIPLLRLC